MSEKMTFLNMGIVLFVISLMLRCYQFYYDLRGGEGIIDLFCDFAAIEKSELAGFLNVLIIIGLIVIILHCSEFKDYKEEFLDRFHGTVVFSISSTAVMFLLGAIFDHCLIMETPDDPGLVIVWMVFSMSMYILFVPLLIIVLIININIWNKAVIRYNKKQKELKKSHSE